MKHTLKTLLIVALLLIAPLFMFAQMPPLPGETPPAGSEMPGAGAPVGNGTFILLTLAVAYAARKVYVVREEEDTE